MTRLLWTCAVATVSAVMAIEAMVTARAQDLVFRAAVDLVSVDVSVRERGKPVSGLTASDFEITDNGVVQRVTDVNSEALPIDVSLVVDLSLSVQGPMLEALTRATRQVRDALRPVDRASLLTFNYRLHEVHGFEPASRALGDNVLGQPAGPTSLIDAMTVALIRPSEPGRRQMAILFTDGEDTASFLDARALMEVARRAGPTVFAVAVADGTKRAPRRPAQLALLEELTQATGGQVAVLQRDEDLGPSFIQLLDGFRASYVVRYALPQGGPGGWHAIGVRIPKNSRAEVRARKGYMARATP